MGRADGSLSSWPLLAWLLVQLIALLLPALRVPMAAEYPRAGERLAVYWLLAAQVVAAAALMPWLLRGWRTALIAAAGAWPMLAIAAVLSAVPPARALAAGAYVTAWLAALFVWGAVPRTRRFVYIASAVASAVAAGGPLLWYLRAEFGPPESAATSAAWQYGPVLGSFSFVTAAPAPNSGWRALLAIIALGVVVLWFRHRRAARQPAPTPA